jgi:uronate dehydrogenase
MRVLVTGAAGGIGRVVTSGLTTLGHQVVPLDLVPEPLNEEGAAPRPSRNPWHQVDCTDGPAVDAVFAQERPDAVVHLAGNPGEASLPDSLASHVVSTGALLDAMVAHGCRRMVYASSNHAVGRTERTDVLGVDVPPRPDTFYGVAKVAAEAVLRLYADRYGLDAVSCRIGSFLPQPTTVRHLSTWLSAEDCVRMVEASLTTQRPGYAVLYGISANTRSWWDLEPGRRLGYAPQDDAEGAYVGGPFTGASHHRPALDPGPRAAG